MRCDGCEVVRIQGLLCHETGCGNSGKTWFGQVDGSGYWARVYECWECGEYFNQGSCCPCHDDDNPEDWN